MKHGQGTTGGRATGVANAAAVRARPEAGARVIFEVGGLRFSYGRTARRYLDGDAAVLRDINLTILKGAFYSIIGPNGSGKTTLLNVLSGFLPVTEGRVVFDGRPIGEYSVREIAQRVSFIRQAGDVRFPFTCLELVLMGRSPFGNWTGRPSTADLEIACRAMQDTDTVEFASRAVTALSAGERQRVLFARALAQTPRVLFLDEAFSNMDIFYVVKLLGLIRNMVRREGLTVVSVTHDLNMAHAFSDYVIAMDAGRVVRVGPPDDVVNGQFIRALLGVQVAAAGGNGAAHSGGAAAGGVNRGEGSAGGVAADGIDADGVAADGAWAPARPVGIAVLPELPEGGRFDRGGRGESGRC